MRARCDRVPLESKLSASRYQPPTLHPSFPFLFVRSFLLNSSTLSRRIIWGKKFVCRIASEARETTTRIESPSTERRKNLVGRNKSVFRSENKRNSGCETKSGRTTKTTQQKANKQAKQSKREPTWWSTACPLLTRLRVSRRFRSLLTFYVARALSTKFTPGLYSIVNDNWFRCKGSAFPSSRVYCPLLITLRYLNVWIRGKDKRGEIVDRKHDWEKAKINFILSATDSVYKPITTRRKLYECTR